MDFTAQPFSEPRDPKAVYANNELCLEEIDVYGFDYDYTLACYGDSLHYLIYDMGRDALVNHQKASYHWIQFQNRMNVGTIYSAK